MYEKRIKIEVSQYGDLLNPRTNMIVIEATINRMNALKLAEELLRKVNATRDSHIDIVIGGYPNDDY